MRSAALVLVVLSFPLAAGASRDGERFGSKGTIAPSGSVSISTESGTGSLTMVSLSPTAYFFVSDNFAVGGGVGLMVLAPDYGDATTTFSLSPQVGYNIHIAPQLSVFPTGGLTYSHTGTGGTPSFSVNILSLDIHVPLLVHVGNFFLGGGPFLSTQLLADRDYGGTTVEGDKTTRFGLATTIGGWL